MNRYSDCLAGPTGGQILRTGKQVWRTSLKDSYRAQILTTRYLQNGEKFGKFWITGGKVNISF